MKRLCPFSLSVLFILVFAAPVFGSTPDYVPQEVTLTIPPGSSSEMPLSVDVEVCYSHVYDVLFVDRVEGSLPNEWVSASPSSAFMVCRGPSKLSSIVRVSVPETAAPGEYSGYVFSRAIGVSGFMEPEGAVLVKVNVPSDCGEAPEIQIHSVEMSRLWMPKGAVEPVSITGTIVLPDGCRLSEAGYSIDDEYDIRTGLGGIVMRPDHSFSATVPLAVSRREGDSDGRSYTITIYAINEAGIGQSQSMELVVQRDNNSEMTLK